MSVNPFRLALAPFAILLLAGFRMPAAEEGGERLLYDVRGAFVTAQAAVPHELIVKTDLLVDTAIQSTSRSMMLPRAILTVRIGETHKIPVLFGNRYSATVTVKVVSVSSGEPVAEGSFETSVLAFGKDVSEAALAEKIADRIASEFSLDAPRRTMATALTDSSRP